MGKHLVYSECPWCGFEPMASGFDIEPVHARPEVRWFGIVVRRARPRAVKLTCWSCGGVWYRRAVNDEMLERTDA